MCPNEQDGLCIIATRMAHIQVPLSPEKCAACLKAFTPRSVNAITCSMARNAQIESGLKPNDSLLNCIYGEFNGPGTELAVLIKKWAVSTEDCGCDEKAALMNVWGTDRCRKEIDTIVGWLMESYQKTKFGQSLTGKFLIHRIVKLYAKRLVNRAIENAEHRQMQSRIEANSGT